MNNVSIYHNPRCSKSRQTLALLEENNCSIEVIEYLKTPLSTAVLEDILSKLNVEPRAMMRTKEAEYKEQGLAEPSLTTAQLIQAMVDTPKLIERPIVLANNKAAIGRPPESVLAIL
ncbi:arsenate reductase (glutaredoxin) [Shewanella marinintestina]|uniref:arsenate reductase (glutaredoxin) n=1 Tax=Shewanella marinintestina TaxID=190305 RepID=UPI00200E295B|nr:arsenate reductase (glutaredoxin) [Shewanella marinintestina]MCL1144606.1 arsenate reductase (glutaredoxin) [Shewanella marinintestina]